ncbi:MAG: helix-turn-helix domain-containing protein [Mycoplasmatales bacterium]
MHSIEDLGKALKNSRLEKKLTIDEVCSKLMITKQELNCLEAGETIPRKKNAMIRLLIIKYAEKVDLPLKEYQEAIDDMYPTAVTTNLSKFVDQDISFEKTTKKINKKEKRFDLFKIFLVVTVFIVIIVILFVNLKLSVSKVMENEGSITNESTLLNNTVLQPDNIVEPKVDTTSFILKTDTPGYYVYETNLKEYKLTFSFTDLGYVSIYQNNKQVINKTYGKDSTFDLNVKEGDSLKIKLGSSSATHIKVNGSDVKLKDGMPTVATIDVVYNANINTQTT